MSSKMAEKSLSIRMKLFSLKKRKYPGNTCEKYIRNLFADYLQIITSPRENSVGRASENSINSLQPIYNIMSKFGLISTQNKIQ